MAVLLPNLSITIPDEGNHAWYTMFVALMTALDTAVAADDYIVPASSQHIEASMAALFDDLYGRYYLLATTTPADVIDGAGDTVLAASGLTVIVRI